MDAMGALLWAWGESGVVGGSAPRGAWGYPGYPMARRSGVHGMDAVGVLLWAWGESGVVGGSAPRGAWGYPGYPMARRSGVPRKKPRVCAGLGLVVLLLPIADCLLPIAQPAANQA